MDYSDDETNDALEVNWGDAVPDESLPNEGEQVGDTEEEDPSNAKFDRSVSKREHRNRWDCHNVGEKGPTLVEISTSRIVMGASYSQT